MDQIKKKNSPKKKHKFFPLPYILVLDIKKKYILNTCLSLKFNPQNSNSYK